jgi:hypothetical protein
MDAVNPPALSEGREQEMNKTARNKTEDIFRNLISSAVSCCRRISLRQTVPATLPCRTVGLPMNIGDKITVKSYEIPEQNQSFEF